MLTDLDVLDSHFESHQLLVPDGPLLRTMAAIGDGVSNSMTGQIHDLAELLA